MAFAEAQLVKTEFEATVADLRRWHVEDNLPGVLSVRTDVLKEERLLTVADRRDRALGVGVVLRPVGSPYDLRHSFVSLLIAEGASVVGVARQAGHAPTMSPDTYAHVFEASGGERVSAEDAIRAAREVVPPMCPAALIRQRASHRLLNERSRRSGVFSESPPSDSNR